jgi:hypothetical protein
MPSRLAPMGASTYHTSASGQLILALITLISLVSTSTTATAVELNHAREHDLLAKLQTMRVKDPTAVLAAMQLLGLEHDEDFVILNDDEREEMMFGLGAQGISLGDRSKARYHFGILEGGHAFGDAGDTHSHSRPIISTHRRTQESGGGRISSDSIALMATATLGTLSFLVQVYTMWTKRECWFAKQLCRLCLWRASGAGIGQRS